LGCSEEVDQNPEILVFAAASLVDVMMENAAAFEDQSDTKIAFSFGGSQMLAQQIASGAPSDVFISAGQFPIDFLNQRELIDQSVLDLVANSLVVAIRANDIGLQSIEQLSEDVVGRVAIADPKLSPAGRYAREALINLGLWDDLAGRIVPAVNVRVALAYVESGNADAALVYRTDVGLAPDLYSLDIVPSESHAPIIYGSAVVRSSSKKTEAGEFIAFLGSREAKQVFLKHGFQPMRQ